MNKLVKHSWWVVIIIFLAIAFWLYVNHENQSSKETLIHSEQEMKEAIIYFNKSEEFEKALVLAKEYVSQYPEDMEGWIHRGYAYMGMGNCIEASANFYHAAVNGYEEASELLTYVSSNDICKNGYKPNNPK